jgi:hypothetical protein
MTGRKTNEYACSHTYVLRFVERGFLGYIKLSILQKTTSLGFVTHMEAIINCVKYLMAFQLSYYPTSAWFHKQNLQMPKCYSEAVTRIMADNAMAKRKMTYELQTQDWLFSGGLTTWCSHHMKAITVLLYQNCAKMFKNWLFCSIVDNKIISDIENIIPVDNLLSPCTL